MYSSHSNKVNSVSLDSLVVNACSQLDKDGLTREHLQFSSQLPTLPQTCSRPSTSGGGLELPSIPRPARGTGGRCAAFLFSCLPLAPRGAMFPSECHLSVSFETSSSPLDTNPGGVSVAGSLSCSPTGPEERGEFCRQTSYCFCFPLQQWKSKITSLPIFPLYTGASQHFLFRLQYITCFLFVCNHTKNVKLILYYIQHIKGLTVV